MNWQHILDGYEFRVYISQGRYAVRTVETVNCSLDDGEFNKLYQIMRYLPEAVNHHHEGCTEDIAQYIENKIGMSEDAIMTIIDPLVQCDVNYDEKIAQIICIDVFRYEEGRVQKIYIEGVA